MIAHRELDVNKAGARGIDTIFTLSLKIAPESLCLAIVTAVGANGADVMQKSAPTTFMYRYCISCESCSPLDIKLPPPNIFACPIRWGVGLRRRVRRRLPDPCCDQDGTRPARDGDGAQSDTRRRGTECSDLVLRHGRGHCPHPRHSVRDDEARADRSVVRGCSGRGHTTCAIRARKCVLCPPPHRSNVPPLASSPAFFLRSRARTCTDLQGNIEPQLYGLHRGDHRWVAAQSERRRGAPPRRRRADGAPSLFYLLFAVTFHMRILLTI